MSFLDSFLSAGLMQKATQALQVAEVRRKLEARKAMLEVAKAVAGGASPETAVEGALAKVLVATSQAPALREIGKASGNALAGELLGKIADKLENK